MSKTFHVLNEVALCTVVAGVTSLTSARYFGCTFRVLNKSFLFPYTAFAVLGVGVSLASIALSYLAQIRKTQRFINAFLANSFVSGAILASLTFSKRFVELNRRDAIILTLVNSVCYLSFEKLRSEFHLRDTYKEEKEKALKTQTQFQQNIVQLNQQIENLKKGAGINENDKQLKIKLEETNEALKIEIQELKIQLGACSHPRITPELIQDFGELKNSLADLTKDGFKFEEVNSENLKQIERDILLLEEDIKCDQECDSNLRGILLDQRDTCLSFSQTLPLVRENLEFLKEAKAQLQTQNPNRKPIPRSITPMNTPNGTRIKRIHIMRNID